MKRLAQGQPWQSRELRPHKPEKVRGALSARPRHEQVFRYGQRRKERRGSGSCLLIWEHRGRGGAFHQDDGRCGEDCRFRQGGVGVRMRGCRRQRVLRAWAPPRAGAPWGGGAGGPPTFSPAWILKDTPRTASGSSGWCLSPKSRNSTCPP